MADKKSFTDHFLYWKIAILKCLGKALMGLLFSLVATLNGSQWNEFTHTEKFIAIVSAVGAAWTVIDAFLDQTMARLRQGEDKPVAVDDKKESTPIV